MSSMSFHEQQQPTIYMNENGVHTMSIGVGRDTTSASTAKMLLNKPNPTEDCKYTGDLYDDKKHGKGVLIWPDGRMYMGAFYADRRHGFGTFKTADSCEFQGLYRHDERFGPGVLSYKSTNTADVGLWLCEDLIRLLYSHPNLQLDFQITDKKPMNQSSLVVPSWYSPPELLSTIADLDIVLKKKTSSLFCKSLYDDQTFLSQYLTDHSRGVYQAMNDKRIQLDAYIHSFHGDGIHSELLQQERIGDVLPSNETYEQRQVYNYMNKFWPLKKRATFPIDQIISNTRSAFPDAGPLETASLLLFDLSFHGDGKAVRDLLMHRSVYVDVCDSHGFTALHFASYNVHIHVVNLLLDFGANVNQLTDDGLSALAIGFLLYYGNDPLVTMNMALEHVDPVIPPVKAPSVTETSRSQSKNKSRSGSRTATNSIRQMMSRASTIEEEKLPSAFALIRLNTEKNGAYGYEMTDDLREKISHDQYRSSVHSLIKLLLRRGADPTLSEWPIPVLAFAIRAGDKEMVELLLKKKAQVNCRLSSVRHAYLTPLHIACGCLTPTVTDIVQLLLKHGAEVNAESLPGGKEYLTLTDPVAVEIHKTFETEKFGRTPLHIVCARDPSDETLILARLLLEHGANPNAVCNGQTPLSLAIIMGNETLVDLLLDHELTDPATLLGLGNGNALCFILSTAYESRWTYAKRLNLIERLISKNHQVLYPIRYGPKNYLGSCVDFAYYSFFADARISQTPFHALSMFERANYTERKELLAYIAKRFREEVNKYDDFLRLPTPVSEPPSQTPSVVPNLPSRAASRARSLINEKTPDYNFRATGEFHYCATCGRSIGVRLTRCKRCQKVCFCSKPCKATGWTSFHRVECQSPPPQPESPTERAVTTTKTVSSKSKLPSLRPGTKQTELSQMLSIGTSGTRLENATGAGGGAGGGRALFKESVLDLQTPATMKTSNSRLPNLSVAKLIRQQRLKKMNKSGELFPSMGSSMEGSHLSWNPMYNARENYSFN